MFNQIRSWLQPPTFADEEKTRMAALLNIFLWGTAVLEIVRAIVFFLVPGINITASLMGTAGVFLLLAGMFALMRRGRIRFASLLLITLIWAGLVATVFVYGGVRGGIMVIIIEIVVAAGLLLGGWWALGYATATTAVGFVALILEQQGRIAPNLQVLSPEIAFTTVSQTMLITGLLLYLYHRSFMQALTRARANERAVQQSNRELGAIRASLEETVAERTQKAERARQEAEEARQAMAEQVWLVTGQAELNDVMRGEQDVQELAQRVMQKLCRYLEVPVGTLFLLDGEWLQLAGSFAYAPAETPRFRLGEGMVGQAALEKRPLRLEQIPAARLRLVSGLGTKKLSHLFVLPFLFEERVLGVIEIGHWQPFRPEQREFLERVMENVAIAFHGAQTRAHINELLAETQQQAEELQAQEEELRMANESLATRLNAETG